MQVNSGDVMFRTLPQDPGNQDERGFLRHEEGKVTLLHNRRVGSGTNPHTPGGRAGFQYRPKLQGRGLSVAIACSW